ncbi:DNA-directed RNA polymerase subunit beta [Spironucleus salmonicida]|uniref:DNA-directed RNA polymerase subunit beta n=1 Tax=Spironucleus salmonicida TaxID=348837 RepID=V6LM98_9EUKA|nr:DNA-directed RNA polymerase subunit beta [Spironucleus salmonicida]|eukprot:EST44831.1 DNA-directed RNA polymerase RPB2 [Spironucleus salmonicida]
MQQSYLRTEHVWKVIDAYFNSNSISRPQISSFENFMDNIPKITQQAPPIIYDVIDTNSSSTMRSYRYEIRIQNVFPAQQLASSSPNSCRLQNETYQIPLTAQVNIIEKLIENGHLKQESQQTENMPFCKMPILVGSKFCYLPKNQKQKKIACGECPFDEGGYFIINGSEKAVIASEVNRSNRVQVLTTPENELSARVVSSIPEKALYCKLEVKMCKMKNKLNNNIMNLLMVNMPGFDAPVNLFIMLAALQPTESITSEDLLKIVTPEGDQDIIEACLPSLDVYSDLSPLEALEYLSENLKLNVLQQSELASTKALRMRSHLITRFMPHMGTEPTDTIKKSRFLGYMAKLVLKTHLNQRPQDDRDHWGQKRLQLTGSLLFDLFRRCYEDFQKGLAKRCADKKVSMHSFFEQKIDFEKLAFKQISQQIISSLATGNWRTGKLGAVAGLKTGVSQNLIRLSYAAAISQIRRASSGIEESSKAIAPRMLHGTQFGYLCPAETPEGAKVGLVKNFSLQCYITVGGGDRDFQKIWGIIDSLRIDGEKAFQRVEEEITGVKLFLNGKWIGCVRSELGDRVAKHLRGMRSKNQISFETGISFNQEQQELVIACDEGRVMRPLFVVNSENDQENKICTKLELSLKSTDVIDICGDLNEKTKSEAWEKLVSHHQMFIEYLDPYEEEQALISFSLQQLQDEIALIQKSNLWLLNKSIQLPRLPTQYTHLEIHPSLMLSAIAALIPFPDHNQSPRNLYQSSMGKQAIGIYALNFNKRFDTSGINVMHYPQIPMCQTRTLKYVKFTDLPAGENMIVAIAVYTGFNQEDSLIMSHAAVDRGLMRCTYYQSHETTCETQHIGMSSGDYQPKLCRPIDGVTHVIDPQCRNYLEADGLPKIGASVRDGKVIIGKAEPLKDANNRTGSTGVVFVDKSILAKNDEIGYIDAACICLEHMNSQSSEIEGGQISAKVRVRASRPPQMGDKFASRHGQKGTVGMLYRHEDLPYTVDGITPDIIVNPHAIPSRMTIGQLLECVGSKFGCILGRIVDGTPFEPPLEGISHEEFLCKNLHSCGFQKHAYEAMFCGFTGSLLNYRIFIGPTFYQRLKHMVLDKVSARATGQIVTITRQPNEGRQRYGGMRIGEMERDAFIAHGTAAVLRDRLMFSSDATDFLVCVKCGQICWHANLNEITSQNAPNCKLCNASAKFAKVTLPYATKYLFQEIMGMGVFPSIQVEVE